MLSSSNTVTIASSPATKALAFALLFLAGCGDASLDAIDTEASALAAPSGIAINAGGPAVAPFVADASFQGGQVIKHANVIDVSAVSSPPPAAIYQTARTGNFSYTFAGFAPAAASTVRLHFAETYFGKAGARVFNVSINGAQVLTSFDVFAASGAKNKAIARSFTANANASGAYVIQFTTVINSGLVSAIEIKPASPKRSVGCGLAPSSADSSTKYIRHDVHLGGLDPVYLPGGAYAKTSPPFDFSFRPYSVRLPANYDPNRAYPISIGGGGCGGTASGFASSPGGGFQVAPAGTAVIQVGLTYLTGCFDDGGPSIGNRTDTPELPYLRAVVTDVEAQLCVDTGNVFLSGWSSGAFEAYTLGCAASDLVRGITTAAGGLRAQRPACKGPVAALMVAGMLDSANPIGPLPPTDPTYIALGGPGSAPARDDLLSRNGCVGTSTAPWDPAYPACVKYTGCPAAYPVVWCPLPGVGHSSSTYNGVDYAAANMWTFLSSLPTP